LVPAYGKLHFKNYFKNTKFFHIIHNLDPRYEGRLYPNSGEGTCDNIHQIDRNILIDPNWQQIVINPSRAAIMMCDNWGTVSNSYKNQLLSLSPLAGLLREKGGAFAFPNGVYKKHRLAEGISIRDLMGSLNPEKVNKDSIQYLTEEWAKYIEGYKQDRRAGLQFANRDGAHREGRISNDETR
jgi:hypothetical protein